MTSPSTNSVQFVIQDGYGNLWTYRLDLTPSFGDWYRIYDRDNKLAMEYNPVTDQKVGSVWRANNKFTDLWLREMIRTKSSDEYNKIYAEEVKKKRYLYG